MRLPQNISDNAGVALRTASRETAAFARLTNSSMQARPHEWLHRHETENPYLPPRCCGSESRRMNTPDSDRSPFSSYGRAGNMPCSAMMKFKPRYGDLLLCG